jgi:hypothetical protein
MTSLRWSKLLSCVFLASVLGAPVACGDDDDDEQSGATAGNGGSGSGTSGTSGNGSQPASNCANRCGAIAGRCGAPATLCTDAINRCATSGSNGSGGSGGAGGSGGSGGAGAIPDSITVSGKRKPGNVPINVPNSDQTEIATNLNGEATITYSFAAAQAQLKLQEAGGRSVTAPASPTAAECAGIASIGVTLNATEFGYVFVGVDTLPATACLDFGDAVHESGLTMRFTDVPMLNSTQKVKEVIVNVEP